MGTGSTTGRGSGPAASRSIRTASRDPLFSAVQQTLLIRGHQRIFVVVDDGDFPAFARPYPRLGDGDDRAVAPHSDGLIVAFCNNIVGHLEVPHPLYKRGMFESGFGRNSQRRCRFGGILRADLGALPPSPQSANSCASVQAETVAISR